MRISLPSWLRTFHPSGRSTSGKSRRRRRLQVEELERREAPSASPIGPEFRVNTFTTGAQKTFFQSPQSVAVDAAGDFVVTWSSVGQDGSAYGIYAQRYNAAGVPQGGEFQVNAFTTNN